MLQSSPQEARRVAGIFKVLSHPDRVRITCLLADGREVTQRDLLAELHWPQSTLARHVGTLRERGLIRATRRGNEVYLQLIEDLPAKLLAAVCAWVREEQDDLVGMAGRGWGDKTG